MPTIEQVLSFIQTLFPGQLVLYPPQLAQLMGKSEKALKHLIERESLPFEVKKIGNRWCVDVFRVAEWLSRDEGEATGARQVSSEKPTRPTRSRASSSGKRSSLGGKLMEMRTRAAAGMRRGLASNPGEEGASSFAQEFITALLQPEPDDDLAVDAELTWVVNGGVDRSRNLSESFVRIADAAERVFDLQSEEHVVAGTITVSRNANPIFACSLKSTDRDGLWNEDLNHDPRFNSWLGFIGHQVTQQNEGLSEFWDERLPMEWFSAQSFAVRREVRTLCAFSVPKEFFREVAASVPLVRDAELVALLHDAWSCLASRLAFDVAISKIDSADELNRFISDAELALSSPEAVRDFEEFFRADDELDIVWNWLRERAYRANLG